MIEFPTDVVRVAFVGDLHKNTQYAEKVIYRCAREDVDVIVQVGDYGYDFVGGFLGVQERLLEKFGIILMFVDGNHEDFDWLYAQEVSRDGVRRLTKHIWHLPRNFRWEWMGLKFHALGGAHSVDRQWRVPMVSWWPQEHITQQEFKDALDSDLADVMIMHDAPTEAPVPLGDSGWIPPVDLHAAEFHRELLQNVINIVRPYYVWHGHYHTDYQGDVEGTHYRGLDCDGNELDKVIDIVDLVDLVK